MDAYKIADICKGHETVQQVIPVVSLACHMQCQVDLCRRKPGIILHIGALISAVIRNHMERRRALFVQQHVEPDIQLASNAVGFIGFGIK